VVLWEEKIQISEKKEAVSWGGTSKFGKKSEFLFNPVKSGSMFGRSTAFHQFVKGEKGKTHNSKGEKFHQKKEKPLP